MRTVPVVTPFLKALGAAPVMMQQHEIYSAMDRGVVDGFWMSTGGFVGAHSWHEVTKYMVTHPFYRGGLALIVNPKSWDRVPKDLQKKIKDWKYNVWDPDPNGGTWFFNWTNEETKLILKSGVKGIELSPSDAKKYLEMAYETAWKSIIEKAPVEGPKLKKMVFDESRLSP
jgi:TRAP-type C4-dicarboxylate transport system substrate-binding protein